MVTIIKKTAVFFIILCLFASCDADVLGFLASTDLDVRLEERNSFTYFSNFTDQFKDRQFDAGTEYSFVVFSDTHIGAGGRAIEDMKGNIIPGDKFIVLNGDISDNGDYSQLKRFIGFAKDMKAGMGIPVFPVIGNHDLFFNNWGSWKSLIGSTCYTADSADGSTRLIVLDSANAYFGAKQLGWLESAVSAGKKHTFIFTHNDLYYNGDKGLNEQICDMSAVEERAVFMNIISGKCEGLFSGHSHTRFERNINNIQFITTEDYRDHGAWCRVFVSDGGIRYEFH